MEKYFKIRFTIIIFLMIVFAATSVYFINSIYNSSKTLYEHPYQISNELKLMKISIGQLNRHIDNEAVADFLYIAEQDVANRNSLSVISERYLGDGQDIRQLTSVYINWFEQNIEKTNSSPSLQLNYQQLITAINQLETFSEHNALALYQQAAKNSRHFAIAIILACFIAILGAFYVLMVTLKILRDNAANRRQYSQIIDQNVMISAISDDGIIFDISHRLSRILQKSKKELVSLHCQEVFFSGEDALFNDMWQQVTSGAIWRGEVSVSDGGETWLGIDVLPMQGSDYRYSGFRLLASDITSNKSLEKISITDTLTGLLNRRSLDDVISRQIKLALRSQSCLSFAMIDIDFFKQYNDNYGHPAGDNVLVLLAAELRRMLGRPNDFVFRLGGEEFFLIFNSKTVDSSLVYLEKIRQAIVDLNIAHQASTVSEYVSISTGAVFFKGENSVAGEMLILYADENLYKAKEQRNICVQTVQGEKTH